MKLSIYKNPAYYLSFGNDAVCLDIEIEITRISEVDKQFKARVLKAQLNATEEVFPAFLVRLMNTEQLRQLNERLETDLLNELAQSLFSLFYAGDIQQDATNTSA